MVNWLFEYRGTGPILAALFVILSSTLPCLPNSQASTRAQYCPPQKEKGEHPKNGDYASVVLFLEEQRKATEQETYASEHPCGGGIVCRFLLPKFRKFVDLTVSDPIAAFTLILTLSTLGLWWQTKRLAEGADDQARQLASSIILAREEFISTHRPKIIVRGFQIRNRDMPEGEDINAIFTAQNIGDSTGKVVEVRSGTIILGAKEKIPTDISFGFSETYNFDLASGQKELFPLNGGSTPISDEVMDLHAGTSALYCMGIVVYVDDIGTKRETGFCRRYRPREDTWETIDSEYEYAY